MSESPPKRLPRGQGHLLREQILLATVAMLDRVTASEISIRAIAQEVRRSTPQIYEHFADREALLLAAARSALERMGAAVNDDLADETDVAQRLRKRAHAYVAFAVSHPEPYRILFMNPHASRALSIDDLLETAGFKSVTEDFRAAAEQGQLARHDEDRSAFRLEAELRSVTITMWTSLHGIASLLLTHPDMAWPSDGIDVLLDRLRDGLRPR
jgi:AcrR family transcriptional regulator